MTIYDSGDKTVFGGRVFTCMRVVAERAEADRLAGKIRDDGFLARVTQRTKRYIPKEPTGSYFQGHGGFTVSTYCVWKGPRR